MVICELRSRSPTTAGRHQKRSRFDTHERWSHWRGSMPLHSLSRRSTKAVQNASKGPGITSFTLRIRPLTPNASSIRNDSLRESVCYMPTQRNLDERNRRCRWIISRLLSTPQPKLFTNHPHLARRSPTTSSRSKRRNTHLCPLSTRGLHRRAVITASDISSRPMRVMPYDGQAVVTFRLRPSNSEMRVASTSRL